MRTQSTYEELERRLGKLEQDIAQAKRMDQAHPAGQSLFKSLVERAPIGIIRVTEDGHVLFANEAMATMFGYRSSREFLAAVQNMADLYVIPQEARRHLDLFRSQNPPDGLDTRMKSADGQALWHRIFVRTIRDHPDGLTHEIFTTDITERRLARDSLHESEKRFRMLVEQAGDGFFLHDMEGRILDVNQHACDSLGYAREELLHMNISQIAERIQKQFWQPLTSGKFVTFESAQRRKDGSMFPVEVRLSRLDLAGEVLLLSLVRDITSRKAAEDELKRSLSEIKELKNRLEQENVYLREEIEVRYRHEEIVGESKAIKRTLNSLEQVAQEDTCVLILGETGTGKELVARALHSMSPRRARSMVKVNCAALPATLIESELFGREKGAFTGAMTKQIGRFEAANHSTVFLDEIGDMPLEVQTKLLRVLQDGTFERLGSSQTIKVDVRVVAATNQNLPGLIQENRFRSDLYYRLNVFPIYVPSLRERLEDIPLLVWAFVKEFSATMGKSIQHIPKRDMDSLQNYTWPGNIRELRNVIERAMILARNGILRIERLARENPAGAKVLTMGEMEKKHIVEVLEGAGWRVSGPGGAARILGLNESTLRSRMKKLHIQRPARKS
ncbi:MAG: sigma 54-interacting transcriptional regulator [Thermodesulfobacteriota bacterium]